MLDNPHHKFSTIELDPNPLSTPCRIQTNWHVITGTPCSGKTTLIDQLTDKGFRTIAETARQCFEKEMARGRTTDEIHENYPALQHCIDHMQLGVEHGLRATDVAFLDRALPDSITFCRVFRLNPNEILSECFHHRYASIFVLDRFPV